MDIANSSATPTDRKRLLTRLAFGLYVWIVYIPFSDWLNNFLKDYEGPWWVRFVLHFHPWLTLGLPIWFYRRLWQPDELEVLMGRQAAVFALNGLVIGLVIVDQMQKALLIPGFALTTGRLLASIVGLLLAGIVWSKLRYR